MEQAEAWSGPDPSPCLLPPTWPTLVLCLTSPGNAHDPGLGMLVAVGRVGWLRKAMEVASSPRLVVSVLTGPWTPRTS